MGKKGLLYIVVLLLVTLTQCNVNKNNKNSQVFFNQAQCELNNYDFHTAIKSFNICISTIKEDSLLFKSYCGLFRCYFRIKDTVETNNTIKIIDNLFVNKKNKIDYFDYYFTKALRENELYNYRQAIVYARKALSYSLPNDTNTIFLNYKLSAFYQNLNNDDSSRYFDNKALQLTWLKKDRKSFEIANVFNGIANDYIKNNNDIYTGSCYYDSMLFIMNHTNHVDSDYYAWNLFNLGGFYCDKGFLKLANQYFTKSYSLYDKIQGNFEDEKMIILLNQASVIDGYLRKYASALDKLDKAINYFSIRTDPKQLIRAYFSKGSIFRYMDNNQFAINNYFLAIGLHEKFKIEGTIAYYQPLAECYAKMNRIDSAEFWYKKCFDALKDPNNNTYIIKTNLYGEFARYQIMKNTPSIAIRAIDDNYRMIKEMYGIKNQKYGYYIYWKALALQKLNRYSESLDWFHKTVIASIDPEFNGSIYDVPDFKQSDIISHDNLIDALLGKAEVLALMAQESNNKIFLLNKCLEHYNKAAETIENHKKTMGYETDRLTFTGEKIVTNKKVIETAMQLYWLCPSKNLKQMYLLRAFSASDRGKANVITQNLQDNEYKRFSGIPDSLLEKEKKLQESLILLQSTIQDERKLEKPNQKAISNWQNILIEKMNLSDSLLKYFEENYPNYYRLKFNKNEGVDIATIQSQLNINKTIIEYSLMHDSLYVFVINKNEFSVQSVPAFDVENKIICFRKQISNVNEHTFTKEGIEEYISNASWLYKKLVKPVKNYINGSELVIIPDGVLNLLPFEALLNSDSIPKQSDYGLLPYLVNYNTISYAYSIRLYEMQQKINSPISKGLLVFAPEYGEDKNVGKTRAAIQYKDLLPIPGTSEEAKAITSIFGGNRKMGKDATEFSFKKNANKQKVLHLAMHTIIDNENPMYSKLAFSPGNDSINDGFLNTYEIYNLKLKTPLLVLSACNTGFGKLMQGEGLISLSRGFVHAGCPSMVMTMWSIADKSSATLMKNFYQQLKDGNAIDYSLRLAKRGYIQSSDSRYSHPYYWAGFIQTGKTQPITTVGYKNFYLIIVTFLLISIGAIGALKEW